MPDSQNSRFEPLQFDSTDYLSRITTGWSNGVKKPKKYSPDWSLPQVTTPTQLLSDWGTSTMSAMSKDLKNREKDFTSTLKPSDDNGSNIQPKGLGTLATGSKVDAINTGLDLIGGMFNSLGRNKSSFEGPHGDVRAGIQEGWDSIGNLVGNFGPYGQMVKMGMKAMNVVNGIQGAIFGATGGMTTKDAIFDSPIGVLTGVGWINQAFGSRSDTITRDDEAFELSDGSYGNTENTVSEALKKSGQKYGAFSSGARQEANRDIYEAKRQQSIMSNLLANASDRFDIRNSMSAIAGNRREYDMLGGYNQASVMVGRQGMILQKARNIINNYKKPTIVKEIQLVSEFKEGGSLSSTIKEVELEDRSSIIREADWLDFFQKFENGGKVNVIPEGVFHSRLHHMEDAENLTKKGIPVVSEKENGEIEQQAEIEKNEIIYRISVTKKLEELYKVFYSDESSEKEKDEATIEAGKLLVKETLYNTIDNTGLINNIE